MRKLMGNNNKNGNELIESLSTNIHASNEDAIPTTTKPSREYEILFSYLKEDNWAKDGSPADNDDYYIIGKVRAESPQQMAQWVRENDFCAMITTGHCEEIKRVFAMDDYVEDTLEAIRMLTEVGHPITK